MAVYLTKLKFETSASLFLLNKSKKKLKSSKLKIIKFGQDKLLTAYYYISNPLKLQYVQQLSKLLQQILLGEDHVVEYSFYKTNVA